jgi:hypothetical protein
MFVTIRLQLSFWFWKMVLAGYLEPWHLGRDMKLSQAQGKADFGAKKGVV